MRMRRSFGKDKYRSTLLDKNPCTDGKAIPCSTERFNYNHWFICTSIVLRNLFEIVLEELESDRVKQVAPETMRLILCTIGSTA